MQPDLPARTLALARDDVLHEVVAERPACSSGAARHVRQPVWNVPALDDAFGDGVPIYKFQRTGVDLNGPRRAAAIAVK